MISGSSLARVGGGAVAPPRGDANGRHSRHSAEIVGEEIKSTSSQIHDASALQSYTDGVTDDLRIAIYTAFCIASRGKKKLATRMRTTMIPIWIKPKNENPNPALWITFREIRECAI